MMTIMNATPSRKELSHERIVEVAARAIRRAGFQGVGVADIMKEAGLTHGGFYAHFASRDALLVEALQRAGQDNADALAQGATRRRARGESRFAALVQAYLHESQLAGTECGCVVAALASEMPRQDEAVADEARRRVAALLALVRESLPEGSDPARAELATASLVGALQLARTLGAKGGKALLERSRQALIAAFDSEPTPGAR